MYVSPTQLTPTTKWTSQPSIIPMQDQISLCANVQTIGIAGEKKVSCAHQIPGMIARDMCQSICTLSIDVSLVTKTERQITHACF